LLDFEKQFDSTMQFVKSKTDDIFGTLTQKIRDALGCTQIKYNNTEMPVRKLAICTGSGGGFIERAKQMGADGYITAEVKHDQWLTAKRLGIAVFDCGHYHTENPGMETLCRMLAADFPNVEFVMSELNGDPVEYV
jgi:putative NIF3 family GTP cyclohydrolase 1 type 2